MERQRTPGVVRVGRNLSRLRALPRGPLSPRTVPPPAPQPPGDAAPIITLVPDPTLFATPTTLPPARPSPDALRLVVLGASGDAYLVCSLYEAFRRYHNRPDVVVALRSNLVAIPRLFGVPHVVDDALVDRAQGNEALQRSSDNLLFSSNVFYAHPSFARTGIRTDQLVARPVASQADMYRALLGLPFETPLALPCLPSPPRPANPRGVLVIADSTSWPNLHPAFWPRLVRALRGASWDVELNDRSYDLEELLHRAAASSWVIGPQCGVMSILVTGRFPARKTFVTPSLDGDLHDHPWAKETFPYAYVTKFAGEDHDVEEHKLTATNHDDLIAAILNGPNALRYHPHDPDPTLSVTVPLTPGDFLDRWAVLEVKYRHLDAAGRAAIRRERDRYAELGRHLPWTRDLRRLYAELERLHEAAFTLLEVVVPAALLSTGPSHLDEPLVNGHVEMIRLNRERVGLKVAIDLLLHAPYREVKTYHDEAR